MGENDGRVSIFRADGTRLGSTSFSDDDNGLTAGDVDRACEALAGAMDPEELEGESLEDCYVIVEEDPDWFFNESSRLSASRAGLSRLFATTESSTSESELSPPASIAVTGADGLPQIFEFGPLPRETTTSEEGTELSYDVYEWGRTLVEGEGGGETETRFRRLRATPGESALGSWEVLDPETEEWRELPNQTPSPESIGAYHRMRSEGGFDVYEAVLRGERVTRYRTIDGGWFSRATDGDYEACPAPREIPVHRPRTTRSVGSGPDFIF